jgi:N-acetylglucosamine malate deacetylase 2
MYFDATSPVPVYWMPDIPHRSDLVYMTSRLNLLVSSLLPVFWIVVASATLCAQTDSGPRVLIVTAHPDDEASFTVTIYKITHDLKGTADLALITNAEGGYKYSTLAEQLYGLKLTDEKIGRQYLPAIRKKELMAAGEIIGIRNYFFLDQQDHKYTLNVDSTLRYVWDVPLVRKRLHEIMTAGDYDYVFVLLPTEQTHGHHKGAAILALETVKELSDPVRPVVLGGATSQTTDTAPRLFTGLKGYPVTNVASGASSVAVDRSKKFGFNNALDYSIIVNWLIAEYKTQGTTQTSVNRGGLENYWYFDINNPTKLSTTRQLFDSLNAATFETPKY